MKKRIISLILVIVMLALSLVGCAYAPVNDDLSKYASFNKDEFLAALKTISVKGGDFGADPEIRKQKVMDAIYETLASKTTETTKHTGLAGEHDLFYYCYYMTYTKTVGEREITVFGAPTYMDVEKAVKVQLGKSQDAYTTDLVKRIVEAAKTFELDGKAYSQNVDADKTPVLGNVAAISYVTEYTKEDGTVEKDTVTLEIATLDPTNAMYGKIYEKLLEKKIGTAVDTFEIVVDDTFEMLIDGVFVNEDVVKATGDEGQETKKIVVKDAKVNYLLEGTPLTSFKSEATTSVTVKDVYGNEEKIPEKDITYHVYAYGYTPVNAFNATNVISVIYGKDFTAEDGAELYEFGAGITDKTAEEKKAIFDAIVINGVTPKEGSNAFDTLMGEIASALNDFIAKDTAASNAKTALEKAELDQAQKQSNYDSAAEENKETALAELEKAQALTTEKQTAYNKANEELADAKQTKDNKFALLFAVSGMETTLANGYENLIYDEKQTKYNDDIKEQVAKAVYDIIMSKVTLTDTPKKAVNEAYDMLMNNYKYVFYNEDVKDSNGNAIKDEAGNTITNYTWYRYYVEKGSFKTFVKDQVSGTSEIAKYFDGTIESYKDAKAALRAYAAANVEPIIKYTFVAQQLELEYTNKEFRTYKNDKNNNYKSYEYYYGESTIRNGLQFEKLMAALIASTPDPNAADARYEAFKYDNAYIKVEVK